MNPDITLKPFRLGNKLVLEVRKDNIKAFSSIFTRTQIAIIVLMLNNHSNQVEVLEYFKGFLKDTESKEETE